MSSLQRKIQRAKIKKLYGGDVFNQARMLKKSLKNKERGKKKDAVNKTSE